MSARETSPSPDSGALSDDRASGDDFIATSETGSGSLGDELVSEEASGSPTVDKPQKKKPEDPYVPHSYLQTLFHALQASSSFSQGLILCAALVEGGAEDDDDDEETLDLAWFEDMRNIYAWTLGGGEPIQYIPGMEPTVAVSSSNPSEVEGVPASSSSLPSSSSSSSSSLGGFVPPSWYQLCVMDWFVQKFPIVYFPSDFADLQVIEHRLVMAGRKREFVMYFGWDPVMIDEMAMSGCFPMASYVSFQRSSMFKLLLFCCCCFVIILMV